MLPFCMFVELQHRSAASLRPASSRRNLCSLSDSALDCSLSLFPSFQLSTFDFQPPLFPKSLPFNLFPAPHPITSIESYRYKNVGGRGTKPLRRSDLSPLECAVADKHRVLPVFSRNCQASSPLEATLTSILVNVDSKWFTAKLNLLDATLTKNTGEEGPLLTGRHSVPLAIPHLPRVTEHRSRDTSHQSRITSHPIGPIAAESLWCNNLQRREISSRSGETTPLPPVSNTRERTSGTVRQCSRSETPIRSGLQVVPGSSVLTLDRSRVGPHPASGKDAGKRRVGKAGSVRLG